MNNIKNKKIVFISYSHDDKKWKDLIVERLKVYEQEGYFDIWVDDNINAGEKWHKEIEKAILKAKVAVFLISNNFLISSFIKNEEIPFIREQISKGIIFFPIIIKDCDWKEWKWLSELECRPLNGKPLDSFDSSELNTELKNLAGEIKKLINNDLTNKDSVKKAVSNSSQQRETHKTNTISSSTKKKQDKKHFEPESGELPQWLQSVLFVLCLLSMCLMTVFILYSHFPELISKITFQKKAFTISGSAALLIFIIIFYKLFESTALKFMKINNQAKAVIIFMLILPLSSIYSVGASAYMLDMNVLDVIFKIINIDNINEKNNIDKVVPKKKLKDQDIKPHESDDISSNTITSKNVNNNKNIEQKIPENEFEVEPPPTSDGKEINKTNYPKDTISETYNNTDSFTNSINMKFVYISPGQFMMGSPENEPGRYHDETQHSVVLTKSFYIQTTEVTQGQWEAIMGSNPSAFQECGKNCPVEQVSWNDVQEFISKLNLLDQYKNYRLPTEAEWEYAARAGTNSAIYTGDITIKSLCNTPELDSIAWYCGNSGDRTHPAAQKIPNNWGLYDMLGNVYEWCGDVHNDYPNNEVIDPFVDAKSGSRVVRGGGWTSYARFCRSAYRYWFSSGVRYHYLGFRLVFSRGQ